MTIPLRAPFRRTVPVLAMLFGAAFLLAACYHPPYGHHRDGGYHHGDHYFHDGKGHKKRHRGHHDWH